LVLTPITRADGPDLHALNSEPAAMRFLGGVRTREESEAELGRILAHVTPRGLGGWAVRRRSDDAFLGRCGLKHFANESEFELLYAYRESFWGQGYASEAALAVLSHAFALGAPHVFACASPANGASIRVMTRIGMTFERCAHMYDEDVVVYGASADPGAP
jgi:ribosomal-protein-alanine N-acetyltransferase